MEPKPVPHTHLLAHSKIDHLFTELREALEAGKAGAHEAMFLGLWTEVSAHFASEEKLAIPQYAEAFPEEAAAIRREHEAMRERFSALAEKAGDGTLTARDLAGLREAFTAHEAHEETTLYPWFAARELA